MYPSSGLKYKSTRCQNAEEHHHTNRRENLKSHKVITTSSPGLNEATQQVLSQMLPNMATRLKLQSCLHDSTIDSCT
jgi:hypothetical protein